MVQGRGKFEELMVCSHEIAASTAQLVAASKVGPEQDSLEHCKVRLGWRILGLWSLPQEQILYPIGPFIQGPILPSSESLSSVSKELFCPAGHTDS